MDEILMTEDEQRVWQVLTTCRGRCMAILGPEIEQLTGIPYKRIQAIISGLVCHHGKLIGSGTCGYYLPVTVREMDQATWYLRHRAIVALHRASEFQRSSLEEVFGQAVFEYVKER